MIVNTPKAVPNGIWKQSNPATTIENMRCLLCNRKTADSRLRKVENGGEHEDGSEKCVHPNERIQKRFGGWSCIPVVFPHFGIREKRVHEEIMHKKEANA